MPLAAVLLVVACLQAEPGQPALPRPPSVMTAAMNFVCQALTLTFARPGLGQSSMPLSRCAPA
jgi:hypothetical protein